MRKTEVVADTIFVVSIAVAFTSLFCAGTETAVMLSGVAVLLSVSGLVLLIYGFPDWFLGR